MVINWMDALQTIKGAAVFLRLHSKPASKITAEVGTSPTFWSPAAVAPLGDLTLTQTQLHSPTSHNASCYVNTCDFG